MKKNIFILMSVLFLGTGCTPVMAKEELPEKETVSLSHTLHAPDESETGIFAFQLRDEEENILAEWHNTAGNTVPIKNFEAEPGSCLYLWTKEVPKGYIIDEPLLIEVPESFEESRWTFVSEAVPYGKRVIYTEPDTKEAVYRFYRNEEDEEPYTGPNGETAEYKADKDGSFTAVLHNGRWYVSSDAVLQGYYPLDHQEFFFDLYSEEELKIVYEPVTVKAIVSAEDELYEEGYDLTLYRDEEMIASWHTNEKENSISSDCLEAGITYRLQIALPDTYACSSETLSFTTEEKKPKEIPAVRFEAQRIPGPEEPAEPEEPVIIPVIDPEEEEEEKEETEEDKKEEDKEDAKAEKKEPETAAAIPSQIFWSSEGVSELEKSEEEDKRRSFFVMLEDSEGNGLSGALLRVENEAGETVDQWLSDGRPHRIINEIYAGKTYIITQQSAAEGYEKMQMKISFTVPETEEEQTVTLKNNALSTAAEAEEMKLPRTGLMISAFLAGLCLFALALTVLAHRRQKEETAA